MTKGQRIAKAIREALEVRLGQVLTPELIRERAGNAAHYILEALESDEKTPPGYDLNGETPEEMAERLIK